MSFFMCLFRTTLRQRLRRVWSWAILLLLPCLIIGIHKTLPEETVTAPVQVGVALPEKGGEELWALLEQRSGTVLTFIQADTDTIDRNIAAGRWDCGVIVAEDFPERLAELDTDRIFTLHTGEGSSVYPLVQEAVAACMATLVTDPIAKDYLEDVGIPTNGASLSQVLGAEDRVIVSMRTGDGTPLETIQLGSRSLRNILSWVISAAILVWLLLASHDLGRWSRSSAAKRLLPLRSHTLLMCGRMAADWLLILLPAWVATIAIGGGVYSCGAVAGYSLFWASAGILMARLPALWQNIPVLPPFAVAASLLFSGVLLDMSSLFPGLPALPSTLYMETCGQRITAVLPLLGAAAVMIGVSVLFDQIRKR